MRYVMKAQFVIDCPNDITAANTAKKAATALQDPMTALYLAGQGITLLGVKVDPKPTRE
jgi:hypothetical protein